MQQQCSCLETIGEFRVHITECTLLEVITNNNMINHINWKECNVVDLFGIKSILVNIVFNAIKLNVFEMNQK